jgi:hypothetical protein
MAKGSAAAIACPLAATGVIRFEAWSFASKRSGRGGREEEKAKKAKEEELCEVRQAVAAGGIR